MHIRVIVSVPYRFHLVSPILVSHARTVPIKDDNAEDCRCKTSLIQSWYNSVNSISLVIVARVRRLVIQQFNTQVKYLNMELIMPIE